MRVAIPSDDRSTIAAHFGRTRGFLIYDIGGARGEIAGYRSVDLPPHACSCRTEERPSRHQAVLDALDGCETVIARGMGAHMFDDLVACGIDVRLTDLQDPRVAVDLFLARSLPERDEIACGD